MVVPELLKRKRQTKEAMITAQIAYKEASSAFAAGKSRIYDRLNDGGSEEYEIKTQD